MNKVDREKRNSTIVAMRQTGMSQREIAKALGITLSTVKVVSRAHGCGGRRSNRRGISVEGNKRYAQSTLEARIASFESRLDPGFVYDHGYTSNKASVWIRCIKCGSVIYVSKALNAAQRTPRCTSCSNIRKEKREQAKEEAVRERKRRAEMKMVSRGRQMHFVVCAQCGNLFIGDHKYCSVRCRQKAANNKDRRLRRLKEAVVDKDITLDQLANRDLGICWLCGESVNWDDSYYTNEGTFIAGDDYPSIDHVIPLVKGGLHSWDNVRLAHRKCNTLKRDRLIG